MSTVGSPRVIEASASREGRWWFIDLPELGTSGQTRGVKDIEDAATEIAALWLDVDTSEVRVDVTVHLPEAVAKMWRDGEARENAARESVKEAAALKRAAVHALRADGVTLGDAGILLGLSTQRVHQLSK